jgi:phytoene dehydrogenase-like protein
MAEAPRSESPGAARGGFDAIVIGSGIGALAFSSIMARMRRWRVLVLEQHFKIGGLTHSFSRPGGWTWDVGVHYVGEMGPGMAGRGLFDFITNRGVDWSALPDEYDIFVYPDLTLKVPKGRENYERTLASPFPSERRAIAQYFRDIERATGWFTRRMMAMLTPQPVSWLVGKINRSSEPLALQTTEQYLQSKIRDPRLRAVLASQWADYGLPPSRSAFVTHALIVHHYLDGAWYPVGGAGEIAKAASAVIRAAGGELLTGHEVTRIILDGNRAVGVEAIHKKGHEPPRLELRAPVIVSDAGAWNTFARLLPAEAVPFRAEIDAAPDGMEAVQLFLGLKSDPRKMGFRGENYWIFSGFDQNEICANRNDILDGRAPMVYLSFPSLKDPRALNHTAEIIAPFSYRALQEYRDEPWRRRGSDYDAAKDRITEALLDLVERHKPGFRSLVEYAELGTPLTFEHFTRAPLGAIYGYPATPEKFRKPWLAPRTPIRNLYLTGTDASVLGVMGALMGGVATASLLVGPGGFLRIMRAARPSK